MRLTSRDRERPATILVLARRVPGRDRRKYIYRLSRLRWDAAFRVSRLRFRCVTSRPGSLKVFTVESKFFSTYYSPSMMYFYSRKNIYFGSIAFVSALNFCIIYHIIFCQSLKKSRSTRLIDLLLFIICKYSLEVLLVIICNFFTLYYFNLFFIYNFNMQRYSSFLLCIKMWPMLILHFEMYIFFF